MLKVVCPVLGRLNCNKLLLIISHDSNLKICACRNFGVGDKSRPSVGVYIASKQLIT